YLHNGIGIALMDRAKQAWDLGRDPEPALREAQAAFEQAIAVAPEQGFGYGNVGEVFVQRAWLARARDEDPGASVTAAVDYLTQAIARIPTHPTFWADRAMAHTIQASYDLDHGRDPGPRLDQARSAVQRALDNNPNDAQAHLYLAETLALLARRNARQGRGAPADFATAAHAFEQAIELAPDNDEVRIAFGQFCRAWAAFQRATGDDPRPVLERSLALAERVLV